MICRLCLDNLNEETSIELFNHSNDNNDANSVVYMIAKHLMLELVPEDNISSSICQNCYDHLDEFHRFWLLVAKKQRTLQYEFLEVKCEEPIVEDEKIANENLIKLPSSTEIDEIGLIDLKLEKLDNVDDEVVSVSALDSILDCDVQIHDQESSDDEIPLISYKNASKKKKSKKGGSSLKCKTTKKLKKPAENEPCKEENDSTQSKNPQIEEKLELSCDLCKVDVGDFDSLIEHFSIKHRTKKAFVKCCRRSFTQKGRLLKHLHFHRNPEEYRCDVCKKIFSSKKYLAIHKTIRHEDQKTYNLNCTICDKTFTSRKRLSNHSRMHKNGESSSCQFCGKTFTTRFKLQRHIQCTHEYVYPYKCSACSEPFNFKADLDRHYDKCKNKSLLARIETRREALEEDKDVEEHICQICTKIFCTQTRLKRHIESIHENIHPYICDQCGKKFKFKPAFEKHLLEHSGIIEPPAQCNICGNWLKNKHSLRLHLYAHDGGQKKCHLCGRVCPSRRALRGHIKNVHREEKHFQCKYCEKSFKSPKNLEEHIATHTGALLYTCPHCSKETRSSSNMYVHIKRMHTEEWIKSKLARSNNPDISKNPDVSKNSDISKNKAVENYFFEIFFLDLETFVGCLSNEKLYARTKDTRMGLFFLSP